MRKHPTIYHFLEGLLNFTESCYAELKSNAAVSDYSKISENVKRSIEHLQNGEIDIESFLCRSFAAQ